MILNNRQVFEIVRKSPRAPTSHIAGVGPVCAFPNVVAVHGADEFAGRVGVWMELVHGKTLAQVVTEERRPGAEDATIIDLDLCRALAAVHAAQLLHGDIELRTS